MSTTVSVHSKEYKFTSSEVKDLQKSPYIYMVISTSGDSILLFFDRPEDLEELSELAHEMARQLSGKNEVQIGGDVASDHTDAIFAQPPLGPNADGSCAEIACSTQAASPSPWCQAHADQRVREVYAHEALLASRAGR